MDSIWKPFPERPMVSPLEKVSLRAGLLYLMLFSNLTAVWKTQWHPNVIINQIYLVFDTLWCLLTRSSTQCSNVVFTWEGFFIRLIKRLIRWNRETDWTISLRSGTMKVLDILSLKSLRLSLISTKTVWKNRRLTEVRLHISHYVPHLSWSLRLD